MSTISVDQRFAMQVGDFFRETGEFTVTIPALAQPTLEELTKFRIREIECDISPIEAVTLKLGTVLLPDEDRIGGDEYKQRRISLAGQFGYQQLNWLMEHQDEHPAFRALLGKIYIDGTGIIVVDAHGYRCFPSLNRHGGRWYLSWAWLEHDLLRNGRIAVSGNSRQMTGALGGLLLACDLPKPTAEHSSDIG